MDFNLALKAAEKALEIDPTFYKALANKGNAHFGMKEYHKALEAF
jgi:tetratricopeptide (TPR) repeat protein